MFYVGTKNFRACGANLYMNEVIIKHDKVPVGSRWYIYPIYRSDNGRQSTPGCPSARLGCIPADWVVVDAIRSLWVYQSITGATSCPCPA